jgi:hypothetical protein
MSAAFEESRHSYTSDGFTDTVLTTETRETPGGTSAMRCLECINYRSTITSAGDKLDSLENQLKSTSQNTRIMQSLFDQENLLLAESFLDDRGGMALAQSEIRGGGPRDTCRRTSAIEGIFVVEVHPLRLPFDLASGLSLFQASDRDQTPAVGGASWFPNF